MAFSRLGFIAALTVLSVQGCTCRGAAVGSSTAEIGVVWKDGTLEKADRDATYDFGGAFVGERVPLTLKVRNLGNAPLSLTKLERLDGSKVTVGSAVDPGAAFEVAFEPKVIQPTDDAVFDMGFTPKFGGAQQVRLTLSATGTKEDAATATITLKGKAEGGACDFPQTIDFGKVPVGEKFEQKKVLFNPAGLAATGQVGALVGSDASSFTVSPSGEVAVPAMGTAAVTFTFSPTELRKYQTTLKVKGAGECPELDVTVKGEGSDGVLSWSPPEIDFGYVSQGFDAVREVVFLNVSNTPITLTDITTTLPSDISYLPATGQDPTKFTVAPGGVRSVMKVVCRPSVLGPLVGTLDFKTGFNKPPAGQVKLKAYGGGPHIRVTPRPQLNFGKVAWYQSAPIPVSRKVTVQNTGTKPANGAVEGNLLLGKVVDGKPGVFPLIEVRPLNPNTAADEFQVSLPSSYDPAKGLEATVGKNLADLTVTLTAKSAGAKSAELVIYSNDAAEPAVTLTLNADAQALPPCDFQVSPAALNFGLVTPPGFKDLAVVITNRGQNAGDVCYLTGVDLASGSHPYFSLPGGPIDSKELQPKESFTINVRVSPTGMVGTTVATFTGALQFNISSATKPFNAVPLTAAVGPQCLSIAPDVLDFGAVKKGCSSATRTFSIYNVCTDAVTLKGISVQAPAGQTAGGPECQSAADCPEFLLVSGPTINPNTGLALAPNSAPITFDARYKPIDFGRDSGAIAVSAIQSGQSVTYLVTLGGLGDATGLQTDHFQQDLQPKADILLTVDDSCSMSDKQTNLANNFAAFIQYAVGAGVDYQLGVTTTWDDGGPGGRLLGSATNPKILTPTTPMVEDKFKQKVKVGTAGGTEAGLSTSLKAVTPPLTAADNAGFLRYDANLAVVVVSDAGDQSAEPYTYFLNRFLNVKGFNRAHMFSFNVIGPFASATTTCSYDDYTNSATYSQLAAATAGVKSEICNTNWSQKLLDLGKTAFGFRTVFYLTSSPDVTNGKQLTVKIDGVVVPPADFTFDPNLSTVRFDPAKTPKAGQSLDVTYFTTCFSP